MKLLANQRLRERNQVCHDALPSRLLIHRNSVRLTITLRDTTWASLSETRNNRDTIAGIRLGEAVIFLEQG